MYSSQINASNSNIDTFVSKVDLLKLNIEQTMALQSVISIEELCEALQNMPIKKVPGSDKEFYKGFWSILAPAIYRIVITDVKETSTLPPNMNCANCSLLLKPDKDSASHYCP